MVTYKESDITTLGQFPLAWRITQEPWDVLPPEVLSGVHAFAQGRAKSLCWCSSAIFRDVSYYSPRLTGWKRVSPFKGIWGTTDQEDEAVRALLQSLPIGTEEPVYIAFQREQAAVWMRWCDFIPIWDSFMYPFTVANVFDDSKHWAVLFGPEDSVVYAEWDQSNPETQDRLIALLQSRHIHHRVGSALALGFTSGVGGRSALEAALLDPEPEVRIAALKGLCKRLGSEATPYVRRLMSDPDESVREFALACPPSQP